MEWTRGNKKIDVSIIEYLEDVFKTEMENAYKLEVPLDVDLGVGNDWLEAH